jgi:hypothetical protein
MDVDWSPQAIEAIAYIISGGPGSDPTPPIGIYRSGPKIESFMRMCNIRMSVGSGSRLPSLISALENVATNESDKMARIVERAADPRDFANDPDRLTSVIEYLNRHLTYDGVELQHQGGSVRLVAAGRSSPVLSALALKIETLDFDTVTHDLDRALSSVDVDPEDAVTSACSVVESICRSILVELDMPLPAKKDIQNLYKAVREPLGLSPSRSDINEEIASDVQTILGGLNASISGIGSLRTHGGDAHGKERGRKRHIDARIARLAIHSASASGLFLIETWEAKFPTKPLRSH